MVIALLVISIVSLILLAVYHKYIIDYITECKQIVIAVSKIPGPKCVPIIGNSHKFKLDPEEFTFQMEYYFRKYAYINDGVIRLWLGPIPIIFLTRAKSVKAVLESTKLLWKPPEYKLLEPIWGQGLITSSGAKWHERRRLLTPAFQLKMLAYYSIGFNRQSKILCELLAGQCEGNATFDILPYLRRFSLDIIGETIMGVLIRAQAGENEEFYAAINKIFELVFKNLRYPWFWIKPIWYGLGHGYEFDKNVKVVTDFVSKDMIHTLRSICIDHFHVVCGKRESFNQKLTETNQVFATDIKNRPLIDLLFVLEKEGKIDNSGVIEEVGTFMTAGNLDLRNIGFVLFLLGHHQDMQNRVYNELDDIFGDHDRDVVDEDLTRMKYLEQCIKESIRLYPTVVLIGRRITETIKIGDTTIPKGVTAIISPFSVARDPEQWEYPEKFYPDHFSAENIVKRDPFSFLPFSAGIRNCIGQKFAAREEKIALAYILRKFRVTSMITEEENRALPEISLKPSRGFPVRLERR